MNAGLVVLLAIMGSAFAAPEIQKANAVECMACKMMVSYVENMAHDDEPSIEAAIDHVGCDHLGPLAKQCRDLVHQYLPAIIQYVDDEQPPNVICGPKELHMCPTEKKTVVKRAVKKPAEKIPGLCDVCKMLVKYVEDYAGEDEPSIEHAIDTGVCQAFGSGSFDSMCEMMVHMVLPMVIEYMKNNPGMTPEAICEDISFC